MIIALVLAAGQSKRMGQPKMLLPWGKTTVLGQVIETLQRAKVEKILVVTGGGREQVESVAARYGVKTIFNEDFANGEMLSSIQVGLQAILRPPPLLHDTSPIFVENGRGWEGALIVLGDQPQIQEGSVRAVVDQFQRTRASLVVPSYRMRRGHPWLVGRALWEELLTLRAPESPREFINRHAPEIEYVNLDTPSILADLDTPEDYLKSRP